MKIKLALKVEAPPKLTTKSSANEKKKSMRTGSILIVVVSDDHGESYGRFHLCKNSQD